MKRCLFATVASVIGLVLCFPVVKSIYAFASESPVLFDAEDRAAIVTTEPGEITVWYFTETMVEGRYTRFEALPDGIVVRAKRGAVELPVRIDKSMTITQSDGERKSAFKIAAEQVGEYEISLQDRPKDMRFAVSFGKGIKTFMMGLLQFGLGALCLVLAAVLFVLAAANIYPKKTPSK